MGVSIVQDCDTIDYADNWNFEGKAPTYLWDAQFPGRYLRRNTNCSLRCGCSNIWPPLRRNALEKQSE